jgi:hypothetical protein
MGKFFGWWLRPATNTTTCDVRQSSSNDINVDRVRAALLARSLAGLRKYGTTTERTDVDTLGWLQHLQEELLDAAVYVERLKEEIRQSKIDR